MTLKGITNFFREDLSEVIGAYFDGEKVFIARLTEKFETIEFEAYGLEIEQLAEKISLACREKCWSTSDVGFCLREEDAVIFWTEVENVPEKEIPALVKSWAMAQAGKDAVFSFTKVGTEVWMETLPRVKVEEFDSAFKKFNMNLRALSVMPVNLLDKIEPFDRTEFIAEIVRDKKAPNLLSTRGSLWDWKKISLATAAIFFGVMIIGSAQIFFNRNATSNELDAAKISIDNLHEELALKEILDADIAELHKLNKIAAQVAVNKNFNTLINLGKISSDDVRLIKISVAENVLEAEGLTDKPDAVRIYLARVKDFVVKSARLESSAERDDGKIVFIIRAAL